MSDKLTSWPLAIERDGKIVWHRAGTNPPEYQEEPELEAIWRRRNTTMQLNEIVTSDALEFLQALPAGGVPLFLFSPPYNLGNSSGKSFATFGHYGKGASMKQRGGGGKWKPKSSGSWLGNRPAIADGYGDYDDAMPHEEYVAWQQSILSECWRCLPENGAIFYNHKPRIFAGVLVEPRDYVPRDLVVRQRIIWARDGGINFSPAFYLPTYEEILIIAKSDFRLKSRSASGVGDIWRISQEYNHWHPAPFPLELAHRVLETTMPAIVCDPFAGSGTTGKAAKRLGIDFIGCDRNAAYVKRANQEIAKEQRMTMRQRTITEEIVDQADLFAA